MTGDIFAAPIYNAAELERRIAEAVAAEREACAQIALVEICEHEFGRYDHENAIVERIVAAICARGELKP